MHGYFRLGYGVSTEKGRMVCFQAPGAPAKYRLGNECDQYGEFMLSAPAYVGADGVVASANVMLYGYTPTSIGHPQAYTPPAGATGTGAEFGFANFFLDMKGIPWLSKGTLWVGRRYYKREDFHVMDYFYWNPSGLGAGIEDIAIGEDLKFSYAAFVVDGPSVSPGAPAPALPSPGAIGIRNDLQLRGLKLYPGGELQFGLDLVANASDDPGMHGGWGVTVRHVQAMLGGDNKLAVQYGQGAAIGFGLTDSLTNDSDVTRLRFVDVLSFQPITWFGGQAAVIYQHDKLNVGTADWLTVGGRMAFGFAEHVKLLVDVGHDHVKPSAGDSRELTKITIAPAISAGEAMFSRPEFRLFYTMGIFNDAARAAGVDSAGIYTNTDKTVGSTVGVHAEGWW